jgi:hypothetical protein
MNSATGKPVNIAQGFGWFTAGILVTGELYLLWLISILKFWYQSFGVDLSILKLAVLNGPYYFWMLPAVVLGSIWCGSRTGKDYHVIHGFLLILGAIWLIVSVVQFDNFLGESGEAFRLLG